MSIETNECYGYIVGLYNGDCNCLDGRPTDYDASDSGLYISQLLEPKFIDGLLNCDQGPSVWDLMEEVRNLAILNFIGDANALLMQNKQLKRQPYYGGVGLATFTKDLALANGYAGIRIATPLVRSGYLRITSIGALFNANKTIPITIFDRMGTPLHTFNITAIAGTHHLNDVTAQAIELPLFDEYLDYMEYWLQYTLDGTFQPKNNPTCCSCEHGMPPWRNWYSTRRYPWTAWLSVGGFHSLTTPDYMNASETASGNMQGLTLRVELGCKVGEVLCKDQLDYDGNTLAQAMALGIQRKSAALFLDKVLGTPNLNRLVMLDKEETLRKKSEWEGSYGTMVQYVVENVDITANDCFECKDILKMIKVGIMA